MAVPSVFCVGGCHVSVTAPSALLDPELLELDEDELEDEELEDEELEDDVDTGGDVDAGGVVEIEPLPGSVSEFEPAPDGNLVR